jgi:DNA-binding CsgD family transcriptional regulator
MASLWFILAIIYAFFFEKKYFSLYVFIAAFLLSAITGSLMFFKNPFIPVDYGFTNCQFACISIRIINFLIIGFLIFKILKIFFETIQLYIEEILHKNIVLEQLKTIEQKEAEQRFINEMLRKDFAMKEAEITFKRKELAEAVYKLVKFNNVLNSVKLFISEKKYTKALQSINVNRSNEFGFQNILHKFNELYPDFKQRLCLEFPQLTDTDMNICMFITAGLKSIEIAEIIHISETSVAKYRNRLRKKLDLEQNTDIAKFLSTKFIN